MILSYVAFRRYTHDVITYSGQTFIVQIDALDAFQGFLNDYEQRMKPLSLWGLPLKCFNAALEWERDEETLRRRILGYWARFPSWASCG